MARMHSGKHGKSGSKKPVKKVKPSWVRYKPKEVEILVSKLAKEDIPISKIGIVLRDVYGVPSIKTLTGKRLTSILQEKKLTGDIPEDLMNLIKKSILVRKHLEANHKDNTAKRGLQLTESKILRLAKYYKKTNKLPKDWKYDPTKVKLMIE